MRVFKVFENLLSQKVINTLNIWRGHKNHRFDWKTNADESFNQTSMSRIAAKIIMKYLCSSIRRYKANKGG